MTPIEIHPEATREIEPSVAWYRDRSIPAAQGFLLAIEDALEKISESPARFLLVDERHRACNLIKYPFQVVFRQANDRILVVAVAHAKRRPRYWQSRDPTLP